MKLTADQIETGGNAFPNPSLADYNYRTQPGDMGMSLRDWFAGQALSGVMARCANDTRAQGQTHEEMFSEKAYSIADAMIAARSKGGAL